MVSVLLAAYALMGLLLGVDYYRGARLNHLSDAEALVVACLMGLCWFPCELWGAALRAWDDGQ